MSKLIFATVLIIITGCMHTRYNNHYAKLTPDDRDYLGRVWSQPSRFVVDPKSDEACWQRAADWIVSYSRSPIETVSDLMIITHKPTDNESSYWYTVTRSRGADQVEYHVTCYSNYSEQQRDYLERQLSYYIISGQIRENMVNWSPLP